MNPIIVALLLLLSLSEISNAQTVDVSPCMRYFEITDRLRKGDTLSKETWHTFLQDKAIQSYMADQGVNDAYYESYRKNMQIVYMPQKDSILRRRLKDSSSYWLTYMIYQYKKNEMNMRAYLDRMTADPVAYFDASYQYAYTALPKRPTTNCRTTSSPSSPFTMMPMHRTNGSFILCYVHTSTTVTV